MLIFCPLERRYLQEKPRLSPSPALKLAEAALFVELVGVGTWREPVTLVVDRFQIHDLISGATSIMAV